jgi:hypothetical protein
VKCKAEETKAVPGRPFALGVRERAAHTRSLLRGAVRAGFSPDLWTYLGVRNLIAKEFEVEHQVDQIR